MNALDEVLIDDPTIYRIEHKLQPGVRLYTNNHICDRNRSSPALIFASSYLG